MLRQGRFHELHRFAGHYALVTMCIGGGQGCPVCNDNGFISGWQDTLCDGFAASEQAHYAKVP
jgi:hypothetical protein